MTRSKKILIVLIVAAAVILIQKLDFNLVAQKKSGQVEGVSQEDNGLKVVFFDVGQGDSIFIETPDEKQILVDGGPDSKILEKLNNEMKLGDRFIDIVLLSHPHADHLSGLVEVLKRYEVGEIWLTGAIHTSNVYLEFLNLIKDKKIATKVIFSCGKTNSEGCSDVIEVGQGVKIKILYPLENFQEKRVDNLNNSSIVARLDFGQNSIMLVGDAEEPSEKEMLATFKQSELEADVLKVGHQGASDASSQEWLGAVRPKYGIISVGENNYGHPSLRTIRRLERMGIELLRTDELGDISMTSDGKNITID